MRRFAGAALAIGLLLGGPVSAEARHTLLNWSDLNGWAQDDLAPALQTFLETCPDLQDPDWASICAVAQTRPDPRPFFEAFFQPVLIEDGNDALFTGYFEPELPGSLSPNGAYRYPIYRKPPEVSPGARWFTRGEIEQGELLSGRGLEIAWLKDPVDAFFLQVQGSGRISLDDGGKLRVGYGGRNGHDYRSVGKELVRRGIYEQHQVSAAVIRNWVQRNPVEGRELLWHNPSFIFFREVSRVPADKGPLGAMNRSIMAMRSIAVDPEYTPLGAPVWVEKAGKDPLQRLMIAQDTGSAIKGAQRADIFFGTGPDAGRSAGRVRDSGRMVVLLPIQIAFAKAAGG